MKGKRLTPLVWLTVWCGTYIEISQNTLFTQWTHFTVASVGGLIPGVGLSIISNGETLACSVNTVASNILGNIAMVFGRGGMGVSTGIGLDPRLILYRPIKLISAVHWHPERFALWVITGNTWPSFSSCLIIPAKCRK